jgi:hypothetical protein
MRTSNVLLGFTFCVVFALSSDCIYLQPGGLRARGYGGGQAAVLAKSKSTMRLRGGSGEILSPKAPAALTEEEEAMCLKEMGSGQKTAASVQEDTQETPINEKEKALEQLRNHLSEVDSAPSEFVPCTRKECARFIRTASTNQTTLSCECQVHFRRRNIPEIACACMGLSPASSVSPVPRHD